VLEFWDLGEFGFKKKIDKINPRIANYLRVATLERIGVEICRF
jgi:hypothetical protein